MNWNHKEFTVTNQASQSSVQETFALLQTTYWSHKRPLNVVEKIINSSLCFYLIHNTNQIGFGRVISDYSTLSWVADVVLDKTYQNLGLGTWMMRCMREHPDLANTQFVLQTGSAHEFYERLGFARNNSLMSTPVDYLD